MAEIARKPKVMVVGTFHMAPTTDVFQMDIDNLLSDRRQQEIREVVDRLKAFNPTKLAVEIDIRRIEAINDQYRQYLGHTSELPVNEVQQLGFRIAAESGHDQIFCIDWMEGGGKRGSGDVSEWAKANQPELFESIFGWLHRGHDNSSTDYKSILQLYRDCNEPSGVKQHHTMYINTARIGTAEDYVGIDWLVWWYERNLILFSNLARIATSPEDRILLIIGAGHVQILSQFLAESELFELESVDRYLA